MKRIAIFNSAFISAPSDKMEYGLPHMRLGIISIAGFLKKNGFEVRIFDPQAQRQTVDQILTQLISYKPQLIAFPSYTQEICDAAEIASAIKGVLPGSVIILGGCHVSALPRQTLEEFASFDIGVIGEGEGAMLSLARGEDPLSVPGLVIRQSGRILETAGPARKICDLDALPFPAWELFDYKLYPGGIPLELVRGCPAACTFCYRTTGRDVRYKSPHRIVDEMEDVIRKFNRREFYLTSSGTFPLDQRHAMDVCQEIIRRKISIRWSSATRVNVLSPELLSMMKASGCHMLSLGIESADPQILREVEKGTTPEIAEKVIRMCHDAGIHTEIEFIIGLPHETPQSLEKTLRFVKRVRGISTMANFAILTPFPGTEVYASALRNEDTLAIRTTDWRAFSKQSGRAIRHAHFSPRELELWQAKLYAAFYFGSIKQFWRFVRSGYFMRLLSLGRLFSFLKKMIDLHLNFNRVY